MSTIGAIWWNALNGNLTGGSGLYQGETLTLRSYHDTNLFWLSPDAYHARAPWFCTAGSNTITGDSGSQAVVDTMIEQAYRCGIDYFVMNCHPAEKDWLSAGSGHNIWLLGINNHIDYYIASTKKGLVKFCINHLYDVQDTGYWAATITKYVGYFGDASYQRVTISSVSRPLMYVFTPDAMAIEFGSAAAARDALDDLRAASVAAGQGDPYIVGLHSLTNAVALGCDATSYYYPGSATSAGQTYVSNANAFQTQWQALSGDRVPCVSFGDDPRLVEEANGQDRDGNQGWFPGGYTNTNYVVAPTYAELNTEIQEAITWIGSNPTLAKANTVLLHAWLEPPEAAGGGLCPSLGDKGRYAQYLAQALGRQRENTKALRARGIQLKSR